MKQGWIACSEQLPDDETTVLTYAPDSNEPIWPAYMDGGHWMDINGSFMLDSALITHWMAFPEPPEAQP